MIESKHHFLWRRGSTDTKDGRDFVSARNSGTKARRVVAFFLIFRSISHILEAYLCRVPKWDHTVCAICSTYALRECLFKSADRPHAG